MKKLLFLILVLLAGCSESEDPKKLNTNLGNDSPLELFTDHWVIYNVKFNNTEVVGYDSFEFPFVVREDQLNQTTFTYVAGGPNPSSFPSSGMWEIKEEGIIIRDKGTPSEVFVKYEQLDNVLVLRFTLLESGYPNNNPQNGQTDLRGEWVFKFRLIK